MIKNHLSKNNLSKFVFLFVLSCVLVPVGAEGAILYLEPSSGEYYREDVFIVEVRLDSEGEYINTTKVDLTFSQEVLEVKDFSKGNSILTLWIEEPSSSNQDGTISFIGGIPGGYLGEDGLLGKIVFKTKKEGRGEIQFQEDSQVLLNDGFGTEAELKKQGAAFNILAEKLKAPKDEWLGELKKDNIPPELFEIETHQDPAIFQGEYFIIFSTTDKQTGIDYYEVKEGERDWKKTESPYLLEDQALQNIIKVKAVDKAGNERIAEYIPPGYKPPKKLLPYLIIILVLIGAGIIWWIIRRINVKPSETKT